MTRRIDTVPTPPQKVPELVRWFTDVRDQLAAPGVRAVTVFANSWVNYGATHNNAGYWKRRGVVFLTGAVKSGTSGVAAFTLPAGFRPALSVELVANANGAFGAVVVGSDGTVTPTGSTTKFSLEGLSFRAGG